MRKKKRGELSTTLIKDQNNTRTSKTGNPTNGGGLCGTRKTREHENHEEEKKEKVAVGLVAARENFEASATQLAKWTSLSSVYSYAVCANVVDSRTLQTSEY